MGHRTQSSRQKARAAERALGELSLGVTTFADKKRIALVEVGMRALDEEQSNLKSTIDALLTALSTGGYQANEVIEDLRDLSKKWRASQ